MRLPTTSRPNTPALVLMLLLYALGLVLLLASCKVRKHTVQTDTSSRTEVRSGASPRDTLLAVPGSRVEASLPLPLPGTDLPATTARSGRSWSTVSINQGVLTHAGGCDTAQFAATLWDRWKHTRQDSTYVQHDVRTVEVVRTPKWAWWLLALVVGYAALRVALSNLKPF